MSNIKTVHWLTRTFANKRYKEPCKINPSNHPSIAYKHIEPTQSKVY